MRAMVSILILGVASSTAAAQAPLLYRDTTGGVETGILMTYEPVADGTIVHSILTDGDLHDMEIDTSLATRRYHVASPNRKIDYTVTREGNVLIVQGILGGASVLRRIAISPLPWYQAMERSLHDYLVGGAKGEPTRAETLIVDHLGVRHVSGTHVAAGRTIEASWPPEAFFFRFGMAKGKDWRFSCRSPRADSPPEEIRMVVEDFREVAVRAGRFPCVRLREERFGPGGEPRVVLFHHFAPGIGLVLTTRRTGEEAEDTMTELVSCGKT